MGFSRPPEERGIVGGEDAPLSAKHLFVACFAPKNKFGGEHIMKFSESIIIGSTVVKPRAGVQFDPDSHSGCAIGMAVIGSGGRYHAGPPPQGTHLKDGQRSLAIEVVFGEWLRDRRTFPCSCKRLLVLPRRGMIKDIVTHLFDLHVMIEKDWTLDRLVKWIESVEPVEEEQVGTLKPFYAAREIKIIFTDEEKDTKIVK